MKKDHAKLFLNSEKINKIIDITQLTSLPPINESVVFDTCNYKQLKKMNKAISMNSVLGILIVARRNI
jgi:hypothetical protein